MMAKEALKSFQKVFFLLRSDESKGNPGPLHLFPESTAARTGDSPRLGNPTDEPIQCLKNISYSFY